MTLMTYSCISGPSFLKKRWASSPSPMIWPTVMRGLSDEYGSWKINCISWRNRRISPKVSRLTSTPLSRSFSWRAKSALSAHSARRASRRALASLMRAADSARCALSFSCSPLSFCSCASFPVVPLPFFSAALMARSTSAISSARSLIASSVSWCARLC